MSSTPALHPAPLTRLLLENLALARLLILAELSRSITQGTLPISYSHNFAVVQPWRHTYTHPNLPAPPTILCLCYGDIIFGVPNLYALTHFHLGGECWARLLRKLVQRITLAPQGKTLLQDPEVAERYRVMNVAHVVKLKGDGKLRLEVEKEMRREEAKIWSKRVEKMAEVTERLREEDGGRALERAQRHEYEIKLSEEEIKWRMIHNLEEGITWATGQRRKAVEGLNKGVEMEAVYAFCPRQEVGLGWVNGKGLKAIEWEEVRKVHREWRLLLEVITQAWANRFFEKLELDETGGLDFGKSCYAETVRCQRRLWWPGDLPGRRGMHKYSHKAGTHDRSRG